MQWSPPSSWGSEPTSTPASGLPLPGGRMTPGEGREGCCCGQLWKVPPGCRAVGGLGDASKAKWGGKSINHKGQPSPGVYQCPSSPAGSLCSLQPALHLALSRRHYCRLVMAGRLLLKCRGQQHVAAKCPARPGRLPRKRAAGLSSLVWVSVGRLGAAQEELQGSLPSGGVAERVEQAS